jgi:uncharacterized protein (DUF1501 family)
MGERYNAMLIQGDLESRSFDTDGFHLQETVPIDRLRRRHELLTHLQTTSGPRTLAADVIDDYRQHHDRAYALLHNRTGELLDLEREKDTVHQRYGKTMMGQSLLMARRMVEAGVSLVTVNWEDETKTDGVNTCWDTHHSNFSKLKNLLCPIFDQAYSAFIEDLHERGLLETTLVVAIGEFGRTPHMGQFSQSANTKKSGRDHWPSAFTALLAGGGVRGGQVYGATNQHAALVEDRPVTPADLAATILHHLGIDHDQSYVDDMQGLRHRLSEGRPVMDLG